MENLLNDIHKLNELITNSKGIQKSNAYISKKTNIGTAVYNKNKQIEEKQIDLLYKQKIFNEVVCNELDKFDRINIPIIGMKGVFIQHEYYKSLDRVFDDIDILVPSYNAQSFYEGLKNIGYRIELRTMYDNPFISMKFIPDKYMDNTQTLMLKNKNNGVPIDLHSNLNITNAHFTKSNTKFDTDEFFKNSKPFKSYKNIRVFEKYDNLCVLIRHLMKHHVFYGKTQTGLGTPIQHVLDLAVIINSDDFDDTLLYERAKKYNIIPETLFCLLLYNKIFVSGRYINMNPYINELNKLNYEFKWLPILKTAIDMKISDLMIGDFGEEFPKLQKAVDFCESLTIENLNWFIQAFILSLNIKWLI